MSEKYKLLPVYLAERANAQFEWGSNDCCTFAADWVWRVTGADPMALLRGAYSDEESAARAIAKDAPGLGALVTALLAMEPLPLVATTQRGDVVLFESGAGPALGVCVGANFAAVRPAGGLGYFSMRHAVKAWRIE